MIEAAEELGKQVGVAEACRALGVPRSSVYRARQPERTPAPRPTPPRALSVEEKAAVRGVLNSERFWDSAPREVYATLLDEAIYLCHWRTMYRILEEHGEVCERREQRRHPVYSKPALRATGPNQVWTWDITLLRGPNRRFYYLYAIIDMYSRYVVGWMIAERESAKLAEQLIDETCKKQGIRRDQLTLHSDRGSAMRSKTVAQLLIDLRVAKSHSRPYTPTDNPYSESQFKTMKYRPDYPKQLSGMGHALGWARAFFGWYNHEHHHSGIGLMTPATVHYGRAEKVSHERQQVLTAAYAAHPERFVNGEPAPPEVPHEVWINRPDENHEENDLAGPAASDSEPGAQAGSRAEAERALDVDEHLAIIERPVGQLDKAERLLPKLEYMLSQNY